MAAYSAAVVMLSGGIVLTATETASAHGAMTAPGSRTFLCFEDGHWTGGDLQPRNAACAAAVGVSGKQPLWDWFGVLRSDGAGRMEGFIPDGELCSGGSEKFDGFNLARSDWPVTHLTGGANWTFHYNAWAAHPGEFRLYITKDGFDPSQPLGWSDLESEPFSTWVQTAPNGQGEYFWNASLPNKSGRHIIYSVWERHDSKETFYNCSDVVFDGGNGTVTGIPGYSGGVIDDTSSTSTTTSTRTTTSTTSSRTTTPTTSTRTTSSTSSTPTTSQGNGTGSCKVAYKVNEWSGGFVADVTLTAGSSAINGWTITWTFPGDSKITNGWNAQVSQSGNKVTATNVQWNGSVPAGGSTSFGFQGSWSSGNGIPTDFSVTAAGCSAGSSSSSSSSTTTSRTTTSTWATSTTTTSTSSTSSTSSSSSSTTNGSGSALNEDFEGMSSAESNGWTQGARDCMFGGSMSIDTSVAHSGSKSLRINGAGGYCGHVFAKAPVNPAQVGDTMYVRTYIRHSTALPSNHTTFITMNDVNDGNRDLRIGGQGGKLQWNRSSDDATLPEQSPQGLELSVPLPTSGWQCFEFMVSKSGHAKTWLNGQEIVGLTVDDTPDEQIDRRWQSWQPAVNDLKFGWESYGGDTDTLWYDDIAVGSSRIGC